MMSAGSAETADFSGKLGRRPQANLGRRYNGTNYKVTMVVVVILLGPVCPHQSEHNYEENDRYSK